MASGNYYPSYYGQQGQSQSQQSYSNYSTTNQPPTYYQDRSSTTAQSQNYTQSYDQSSAYGSGHDWYGSNGSDPNLGRAAETLSKLGNAARQPVYSTSSYPSVDPSLTNAQSTSAVTTGIGYSYQTTNQNASHHAQHHVRPDSVNSVHSGAHASNPSPRMNRLPTPTAPYLSQKRQHPSIGTTQRAASPAQHQQSTYSYAAGTAPTSVSTSSRAFSKATHNRQRLSGNAQRGQSTAQTSSSAYADTVATEQATPEPSAFTVDPSQVYDPWPEYQRRKAAEDAQRAKRQAEDAERRRAVEEAEAKRGEESRYLGEEQRLAEQAAQAQQSTRVPTPEQVDILANAGPATTAATTTQDQTESSKKPKKAKASKEPTPGTTPKGGRPQGTKKKRKSTGADEDDDIQMLALLKALKAKDPEKFKRLMAADDEDEGEGESTPAPAATAGVAYPSRMPAHPYLAVPHSAATKTQLKKGLAAELSDTVQRARDAATRANQDVAAAQVKNNSNGTKQSQLPAAATVAGPVAQAADKSTIWPPEKKKQLAQTAANHLNNHPENRDRQVQPHMIIEMLDRNPSYILLCEQLEEKGLKIDRAAFARTLLQAVPDVNSAAKKQRKEREEELKKRNGETIDLTGRDGTPAIPPPGMVPPAAAAGGPVQHFLDGSWQDKPKAHVASPYWHDGSGPPSTSIPDVSVAAAKSKGEKRSKTPSMTAVTKEEAARKRDFNDLVDLTALSDDEPEPKRMNSGAPPAFQNLGFAGGFPPPYPHDPRHQPFQFSEGTVVYQTQPQYGMLRPHGPAPPGPEQQPPLPEGLRGVTAVASISRNKARRRTTYDPRTIARDVLLATGRHPDMHPLNAHLEGLRRRFGLITDKADLETLRWDLIDPGEPLPLPMLEDDNDSVAEAEAGEEADDEEEQPPPEPRKIIRRVVGGGEVSASGSGTDTKPAQTYVHSRDLERQRLEAGKSATARGRVGISRGRGKGRPPRGTFISTSARESPRSKDGTPDASNGDLQRFAFRGFKAINTPQGPVQPSTPNTFGHHNNKNKASSPMSGTGYSAFKQFNPDGTKKRGRPVGWRKAVHMNPAKITMADRTKASDKAKSRDVSEPEARYQIFHCNWKGCKSELHNLKTLRSHVNKTHGQPNSQGRFTCLWDICVGDEGVTIFNEETGEDEVRHQRLSFKTQPEWWTHLEKKHFNPLAWKLGDGPHSGLSDVHDSEQSDAYLSDAQGRQVTPRIRTPPRDADRVNASDQRLPHESSTTPGYGRGRGRPPNSRATLEQKALEAEEALRTKKRMIGIGLDKGGATLVNDNRREGFIDDEDFEMIIDDDD